MMGFRSARWAARFARAVDTESSDPDALDPATRDLVTVATRLRETGSEDGPSPQFRRQLHQRLLAVATVQLPVQAEHANRLPASTRRPVRHPSRSGPRLAFVAAMLCALVGLSGVAIVASSRALPGDALYALKRTTEDVSIAMATGPESRAWRLLDAAQTRAHEVRDVVDRDFTGDAGGDPGVVVSTLDDMDANTLNGVQTLIAHAVTEVADGPLGDLAAWASDQRALLDPVVERLPDGAADRARDSLDLLDQIRERVDVLRSQLPCACLNTQRQDRLGPLPCEDCGPTSTPAPPTQAQGAPSSSAAPGTSGGAPPTRTTGRPSTPPSPTGSTAPGSGGPSLPTLPNLPTLPPSDPGLPPLFPSGLPPVLPGE